MAWGEVQCTPSGILGRGGVGWLPHAYALFCGTPWHMRDRGR